MTISILVALTLVVVAVWWGASRSLEKRGEPWFAKDGWLGWDKLDHGIGGFAAFMGLATLLHLWWHPASLVWAFALILVGIEVLELARYATWVSKGRPAPRPEICDGVSWKDALWGFTGGLVAIAALLRVLP